MPIINPAPMWVSLTFFIFFAYGLAQFKSRQVKAFRLMVLPLLIMLLTLAGVFTGTISRSLGLLAWLTGISATTWLGKMKMPPRGIHYSHETKKLYVPGSWVPLLLIMLMYMTLYIVNDMSVMHRVLINTSAYSLTVGLIYGVISGLFLARALAARRIKRRRIDNLIG